MRTIDNRLMLAVKGQLVQYKGAAYKVVSYSGGLVTISGAETLQVPARDTLIPLHEGNVLSILNQFALHLKARHPGKVFGYKPKSLGVLWMKHPFGWQFIQGDQQSVFALSNPGQVEVWFNVTGMAAHLDPLDALAHTLRWLGDQ
jgi:hypothetical protein